MVLAPIAWVMANKELQGIAAGRRDPSSQGMAKAAQVLGIIGTIVWGVILVAMVALLAVSVAGDEVSRTFSEISRDLEG